MTRRQHSKTRGSKNRGQPPDARATSAMLRLVRRILTRKRKKQIHEDFNLLEALADHAPDVFRDELVLKHLDPTTTSLLWQTSKKLKAEVTATGALSGVCSEPGCDCEYFRLQLSQKWICQCSKNCPTIIPDRELLETFELAKWAKENGAKFDGNFTVKAVEAGNIDVLKWVISENCAMPFMAIYRAVKQNRKDMFLLLRDAGCPVSDGVCLAAAKGGHFELLKWLHEDQGFRIHGWHYIDSTMIYDERILNYLSDHHAIDFTFARREAMRWAAERRNLRLAKWLVDVLLTKGHTIPWDGVLMAYAQWEDSPLRKSQDGSIFFGDERFVDWARAQGCPEPTQYDWETLRLTEGLANSDDDWETDDADDQSSGSSAEDETSDDEG